jgi:hypothetical protein
MVSYTIYSCPKCSLFVDLIISDISSGIGSPTAICSGCRNKVNTGRKEYDLMDWKDKLKFYAVSALYVFFVGGMGGMLTYGSYKFLTEGTKAKGENFSQIFLLGCFWAASVIIIQFLRVEESKKRFATGNRYTEIRFPSLDRGLQILYCALLIVPFLLSFLIAYLKRG